MKRYNLINNLLGWLCFAVATVTYMMTLEPTASFWDCPEFISQGFKLEVGHPPGNPIFMLAARFFVNFAGGDITKVALMVNSMSALLSAATILLLFWTITHLVKRLIVKDDASDISLAKMIVIFGSGLCGALVYTWSDTFWFSAVEGEVYAFSSFCTALVFWLILKWEDRADEPHSDKYLILIAYVIGISIAVHLLNLLCIPAIVLVVYYRKWKDTTARGSLVALGVSVVIVGAILYGLVPGFIEISQYFELFCVNTLGMGFNMGVLIYAVLLVASFVWAIRSLYLQRSARAIKISFTVAVLLSGILFIGDSLWIPVLLTAALVAYFYWCKELPVRILNVIATSILVIFIGYSSYALLLIRSSANPPMNQNAPDNVFALSSYLNREQYGDRPLFYGQTMESEVIYNSNTSAPVRKAGKTLYGKAVKKSADEPDRYVVAGEKIDYEMMPELNMLFPRIYSGAHAAAYSDWLGGYQGRPVYATQYVDDDGNTVQTTAKTIPTMGENLRFFLVYQLNHMYWRYFMWNFAGRQNDIQGNGEVNHGNWISGIPLIDTPRLGDQSMLPEEIGVGNKGHNVFYMLPLIMGIIGLCWQAFHSKRGIEQFWVIFFLFFMTGIAIVLYLNQTPTQPRERDYAFAGSFYAFAIWVGMGVAGLWYGIRSLTEKKKSVAASTATAVADRPADKTPLVAAVACAVVGLLVPLQMVSQTWDDHDRSGRTAARDFGMNYLNSLDPNAIIFTNGDNDTFPLWYAQEVEGVRTDVKVVNLSYLTTDWYVNQQKHPSYNAHGIDMLARPEDYAYDRLQFAYMMPAANDSIPVNALAALKELYAPGSENNQWNVPVFKHSKLFIPSNIPGAVKAGVITEAEAAAAEENIPLDLAANRSTSRGMTLSNSISLDMIATSARNGWNRPVYFAMTVPEDYYMGLTPFMRNTGMAYQVTPVYNPNIEHMMGVNTDKAYENITKKFKWGGLDKLDTNPSLYLDETVRRMVSTTRLSMIDLASALIMEAVEAGNDSVVTPSPKTEAFVKDRYAKAAEVIDLMMAKLPGKASPYSFQVPVQIADIYTQLGAGTGNKAYNQKAIALLNDELDRVAGYLKYYQSLNGWQHNTMPYADKYVENYYVIAILQSYRDAGGNPEDGLRRLAAKGVSLDRLNLGQK